ncbi:hypothetical protein NKR19_g931 [Coniochaeta hoffmannii]|uniref:Uncharacterized protein n=1 Tax=Coniochaeta hoffmannii TaxID=91930 RepID=A0AA38W1B8_9PEZI|nr:hypothetical protein NKR19_g931 [Coniochaeta hoffmannii]
MDEQGPAAVVKPPSRAPTSGEPFGHHTRNPSSVSFDSSSQQSHSSPRRKMSSDSKTQEASTSKSGKLLRNLSSWLTVSEPSTQALKHHKKEVFRKANISPDDPTASAKLRIPGGEIPPGAIRPSGKGPDPEDVLRSRARERRRAGKSPGSQGSSVFASDLSQSSSGRSEGKGVRNEIFPFD